MTGTYASFKGKLKAGDRVRHNHQSWSAEAEVLGVYEEFFRTTEGHFVWTWDTATLELLSPSPRVVSLDNLEPGDEVQNVDGYKRRILDVGKKTGVYMVTSPYYGDQKPAEEMHDIYSPEELRVNQYRPVQPAPSPALIGVDIGSKDGDRSAYVYGTHNPDGTTTIDRVETASAPAEKEEEWWEDEKYHQFQELTVDYPMPNIEAIVTEAKRRGAEDALKNLNGSV